MTTKRLKAAASQLDKIGRETGEELEVLDNAIEDVELLHEDHMEEIRKDEEFINDLKTLFEEIRAIRQIESHMMAELKEYGDGNLSKKEFKEMFVKDEEKLVDIVEDVRTELEEIVMLLSEEKRLTSKDMNIEGQADNLADALIEEENRLEKAHGNLEDILLSE